MGGWGSEFNDIDEQYFLFFLPLLRESTASLQMDLAKDLLNRISALRTLSSVMKLIANSYRVSGLAIYAQQGRRQAHVPDDSRCNVSRHVRNWKASLHCKNMWVVLTQLGYHSCNLRIKNNPHVFVYALYNNMRVDFET